MYGEYTRKLFHQITKFSLSFILSEQPKFSTTHTLMGESSKSAAMSTPTFSLLNTAHLAPTKLDDNNYHVWICQFLPILRSNWLMGIVDRSEPLRPKYLPNNGKPSSQDILTTYFGKRKTSVYLVGLLLLYLKR